jgi:hypothetical protein
VTTVTADQCPRITPEFLAAERVALGDWRYRQEYCCEFTDLAGRMFASADIAAIFEAGRLGAVPPGALFLNAPGKPATLRIVDAPARPVLRIPCPVGPEGRHAYLDGACMRAGCGAVEPSTVAAGGN